MGLEPTKRISLFVYGAPPHRSEQEHWRMSTRANILSDLWYKCGCHYLRNQVQRTVLTIGVVAQVPVCNQQVDTILTPNLRGPQAQIYRVCPYWSTAYLQCLPVPSNGNTAHYAHPRLQTIQIPQPFYTFPTVVVSSITLFITS